MAFTEINGSRQIAINHKLQGSATRQFDAYDVPPTAFPYVLQNLAAFNLPTIGESYPGFEDLPCINVQLTPSGRLGAIATAVYGIPGGSGFSPSIDLEDETYSFWNLSSQIDEVEIPYGTASSQQVVVVQNGNSRSEWTNPFTPGALNVLNVTQRLELRCRYRNFGFAQMSIIQQQTGKLHFINGAYWIFAGGNTLVKRRSIENGDYIYDFRLTWLRDPGTVQMTGFGNIRYDPRVPRNALDVPHTRINPFDGGTLYQYNGDPLVTYDPLSSWREGINPPMTWIRPPFHVLTSQSGLEEVFDGDGTSAGFQYSPSALPMYLPLLRFEIDNDAWLSIPGVLS